MMTEQQKYNGWSNYATWRVNLELIDDYVASLVGDGPRWTGVQECADDLAEVVEESISNDYPNPTLTLDYARAFVSDVDYHEIAEAILTDNPELFTDPHMVGAYCECPECAGEEDADQP
jgi:hypothetical protein